MLNVSLVFITLTFLVTRANIIKIIRIIRILNYLYRLLNYLYRCQGKRFINSHTTVQFSYTFIKHYFRLPTSKTIKH